MNVSLLAATPTGFDQPGDTADKRSRLCHSAEIRPLTRQRDSTSSTLHCNRTQPDGCRTQSLHLMPNVRIGRSFCSNLVEKEGWPADKKVYSNASVALVKGFISLPPFSVEKHMCCINPRPSPWERQTFVVVLTSWLLFRPAFNCGHEVDRPL